MTTGFLSVVLIGIFALRCNLSNSQAYNRVNGHMYCSSTLKTVNAFFLEICSSIIISNFL